ncbi:MAG: DUF599 domain-containing protein [Epsilonproteobacteria bacterium]|nr:DUF599 domain-containing protein [Campylobacterota bacterium]
MRKYLTASIVVIGLIGLFVFMEDNSFKTFNILGLELSLPSAVWVIIFLSLFLIFSVAFMAFSNLKNIFYQKNVKKDIQTIISNIKNKILYKDEFKPTKILNEINDFAKTLKGLEIIPEKIENFEFLEDLKKLKEGEYIDLGKYKLPSDNPWVKLNIKNRLKKDPAFAKEALKKVKDEELKKEAFYIWAKEAPIKEILKYDYPVTFEIIKAHIEDNDFPQLLQKASLTPKEEIQTAKLIYGSKDPDSELEIISPLKWGYAYLALKYEHIELAKHIVEENNLKFFEYFISLKEAGIKADIDEYISAAI